MPVWVWHESNSESGPLAGCPFLGESKPGELTFAHFFRNLIEMLVLLHSAIQALRQQFQYAFLIGVLNLCDA
ncbi:MAG: hypothetical protein ABJV08_00005, partial [Parasphingorhabdus sp.]|uniref:hypothetical protein n=1 Tax=Parasphingorhabdus sp. TaxID=2709688 RepID=UPI0032985AB0